MTNPLQQLMPEVLLHRGTWRGTYRHIDILGKLLDEHKSEVQCVFPDEGPVVYIQRNKFTWTNGKAYEASFDGVIRDNKIFWDTPTFRGYGWVASKHIFLLELARKDEPGAWFYESIVMGDSLKHRARTWHWFNKGQCYKRTLCDEYLVDE